MQLVDFTENLSYPFPMPVIYKSADYRKKFDAFRIIDASGHEPLKQAVACALELRQARETLQEDIKATKGKVARAIALQAVSRAINDEFQAWVKIAEFVYAKPRHLTVDGTVTLEQLLAGTWDKPGQEVITDGENNNNAIGH